MYKIKNSKFYSFYSGFYKKDKNCNYEKIFERFNLKDKSYSLSLTFWPHKNHQYLIDVAKIFRKSKKDFIFVLCGSDKGNLKKLNLKLKILN